MTAGIFCCWDIFTGRQRYYFQYDHKTARFKRDGRRAQFVWVSSFELLFCSGLAHQIWLIRISTKEPVGEGHRLQFVWLSSGMSPKIPLIRISTKDLLGRWEELCVLNLRADGESRQLGIFYGALELNENQQHRWASAPCTERKRRNISLHSMDPGAQLYRVRD